MPLTNTLSQFYHVLFVVTSDHHSVPVTFKVKFMFKLAILHII